MAENNTVTFNSILVNSIETNSGIFVGTNSQNSWNSNSNNKSGFGQVLGTENVITRGINIFMDNDLVDTPMVTNNYNGIKQPAENKKKDNIRIYGCRRQGGNTNVR